ncbi:hypothetical protein LEL_07934 [Akanthomyces lecanii RCEF 1005]|uniref:Uncharacterized protein n=1 Tax=Akanthomyces lecanii RCEF 1005 TaxID=1081108 RepID=A0A168EX82_CORDF|nr:hypothetical protein LEL_07934 [Akanthomyces lecanii RCEF 1005]
MARFTFAKGRKKSPPQLVLAEPMSKAHKILGSTPVSIDSPKPWDDASSGFSGGTGNSTATSYASTEDDYSDHHVAIAPSEDEWSNNADMLPAIIESRGLDSDSDRGMSDMSHSLRKTQSSSTIRSWYDKSKQPLPTLPQASAPPMANGVPSKIHKMLDLQNNPIGPQLKKKPPMLDFSNLRSASRLSRKGSHGQLRTDGTVSNEMESSLKSPSIMSLMTPTGKPRKIQKRNTKDNMLSPAREEGQHPHTTGARRRGSSTKEVPSLYDHYEQMSLRQMMQEAETQEGEPQNSEEAKDEAEKDDDNDEPGAGQDLQWLHDVLPTPSQTAFMTALTPAAARGRSNSTASKVTANTKRSKNLDRTDLQETSMLMLSSDSEEDDEPATLPQSQTTSPRRRPSTSSVSPRTVSRTKSSRAPSQALDYRPIRHSKRTSFAPASTYITIPNSSRLSTDTAIQIGIDSRSSTPYTDAASCRTSLISDISSASALHPSSNYIQEARAVTMLAGRRPSRVDCGEEDSPDTSSPSTSLPSVGRRVPSLGQAHPEELTPPLSPTSVDFYIRSARSSIDGPGSHNRYMAVTRQEEMLLSALRNKKQHNKEKSAQISRQPTQSYDIDAAAERSITGEREEESEKEKDEEEEGEESEADSILETENLAAEAMFDFGFPAPPTARKQSFFENAITASASISSFASTTTTDRLSESSIAETESMLDSRQASLAPAPAQMTLKSILKKPAFDREEPEQQEVILYLDDAEPSPDMTDFSELGYLDMPSLQNEHPGAPLDSSSPIGDTIMQASSSSSEATLDSKRVDRAYPYAMASVPEDGELEYDDDGIPRPDSPVSPDAFPAVPQIRTTLSSMARLSAVGSSPMMAEPGWWGDDD